MVGVVSSGSSVVGVVSSGGSVVGVVSSGGCVVGVVSVGGSVVGVVLTVSVSHTQKNVSSYTIVNLMEDCWLELLLRLVRDYIHTHAHKHIQETYCNLHSA